jgi:hypothetical protein
VLPRSRKNHRSRVLKKQPCSRETESISSTNEFSSPRPMMCRPISNVKINCDSPPPTCLCFNMRIIVVTDR